MIYALRTFSVVQSPSCVRLFVTLWTSARQASLSFSMLLEFAQVHVHWISGAIQTSHPLLPSSSAFNLSQHQGVFQWVGCLHQVTKVLVVTLPFKNACLKMPIMLAFPPTFSSSRGHCHCLSLDTPPSSDWVSGFQSVNFLARRGSTRYQSKWASRASMCEKGH